MGALVHRSVPTNFKWFPNCSPAHTLFQERSKDVQKRFKVVQYTAHPLTKLSHKKVFARRKWIKVGDCLTIRPMFYSSENEILQ